MALKDAIVQCLSCMLSSDNEIRKLSEERNKALEVTEGKYTLLLLISVI